MMKRLLVVLLAGVAASGWAAAGQEQEGRGVEVIRDVEYGSGGGRALRLHLLRPRVRPAEPMPAIVWIHGGAWQAGSRDTGIERLRPFARRGCLGASIEYRLSQEATFPAQLEDCKGAVRYLRAKAAELHLDPERIGAWGSSAGGHLAALLGTTGGVKELEGNGGWAQFSSRVQAVCDWFGPTDFLRMSGFPSRIKHDAPDSPESRLVGGPILANPQKVARANPITYVTKDDPPFLIMHGDKDDIVPLNQSELLAEALKKAGVPVTFEVMRGQGHGFGERAAERFVEPFFERHIGRRREERLRD